MSAWSSIFTSWLIAFPSTALMSAWLAARAAQRLLTEPEAYYRSQDPVALAGLNALCTAALLSLIILIVFIVRINRYPEAKRFSEIIKLASIHAAVMLFASCAAVASNFWDGQPTHGRVESSLSTPISPAAHARS